MITTNELRQKYLDFFKSKNHAIIDGSSLIPENDSTVLFTTAGMHPLVPYLLGEKHPAGQRLVNCQKCVRTGDIEEVGDNVHLTYFEMLGNWSLGDYFKKEAIEFSWEFLTSSDWLGLDSNKLAISVFAGDKDAKRDDESAKIWLDIGLLQERISYLDKKENWWGPAGQTGPCGPDTEMFYWSSEESVPKEFNPEDKRWVEIWNDVFMQYNKTQNGKYEPLQQKNVDTGMGLERTVAVLNGWDDVYQVDTIKPIYDKIRELANKDDIKCLRIITDHIRAAVMIMGDDRGVVPSNIEQGYVVRRLIRSAIRRGRKIGIASSFVVEVAQEVISACSDCYEELERNKQKVISELTIEEEKLSKTVASAVSNFFSSTNSTTSTSTSSSSSSNTSTTTISPSFELEDDEDDDNYNKRIGKDLFYLYTTYGLPLEIAIEKLKERDGVTVNNKMLDIFNKRVAEHQAVSRAGSEHKFSGGLADHSEEVKKLHTATHLLHTALRQVLGEHVAQKGSNITKERLRFDFSHPDKMTREQIKQVEDIVNEQISKGLEVWCTEMTVEEAKKKGAIGLFTQKYGDKVKVYTVGEDKDFFSRELCGGPHVENTDELRRFKITKEQASSAGVRRIKATLG